MAVPFGPMLSTFPARPRRVIGSSPIGGARPGVLLRLMLDAPSMREMSVAEQRSLAVIADGHDVDAVGRVLADTVHPPGRFVTARR